MLPAKDQLNICFAHAAYRMADRFAARGTGIAPRAGVRRRPAVRRGAAGGRRGGRVDDVEERPAARQAKRLKFIQSISAGIDQYDQDVLRAHGIRLANAAGVNAQAVAEHAMALILALKRHLHTGRDNQAAKHWRA